MYDFDTSDKKKIGGPIIIGDDDPVTKYQSESDGRTFWAYNGFEVFYEGERLYAALDEIERLRAGKVVPATATPVDPEPGVGLAVVYGSDDNYFFSNGVTRDFGENKIVKLLDGESIFCSVQPLKCEPLACGLRLVGTIYRDG